MLVGSMIESYQAVPAGGFVITAETVTQVFAQVGEAFALSLHAAAPPAIALGRRGHRDGLDRTAISRRSHPGPLSARSCDSGNCSRLPDPRRSGRNALTVVDPLGSVVSG